MSFSLTCSILLGCALLMSGCQSKSKNSFCIPTSQKTQTEDSESQPTSQDQPIEQQDRSTPERPSQGPATSIQFLFLASEPLQITHDVPQGDFPREPINTPGRYNMRPGTVNLRIRCLGGAPRERTATLEILPLTPAVADYAAEQALVVQITAADLAPTDYSTPIRKSIEAPLTPPLPVAILTIDP